MTVYSMILIIFNTVRSQSADQSSLSIKSNVTWLLSCVLYIALGNWTVRNPLLLLNIMVNYSHVGWQLAAIISILYMVWASSVHPVLPFSAHSVPHQSCISVNMIGPASPTPCMPYVAMVQASTITKKLHKITLHHTTLSYQPMLHAPVHHKCSFDSRSSSKALFQYIAYMCWARIYCAFLRIYSELHCPVQVHALYLVCSLFALWTILLYAPCGIFPDIFPIFLFPEMFCTVRELNLTPSAFFRWFSTLWLVPLYSGFPLRNTTL